METEKSKELKHVLREIFFGTSAKRLEAIEEMLRQEEIYSGEDVLITDLNSKSLRETLSSAEMSKFEEYLKKNNVDHYNKLMSDRELEKSKNLKSVLEQIFVNTPKDKLSEIENILKEEQIYLGSHMEILDTNDLRRRKFLPDVELLKIEEYIKKKNKERYDDIKAVRMEEDEMKFIILISKDEIEFTALKQKQELEFMQLKAHEEQKMIEYKAENERLRREEEKAKAKKENEREEMKVQRKKELLEAKKQEENMRVQREKELLEAKTKEESMKMQKEKELIEAKAKQEMVRENVKLQREKMLIEAKAKEMEKEKIEMQKKKIEMQREKDEIARKQIEMQREKDEIARKQIEMQREKDEIERQKIEMQRKKEEIERENMKLQRKSELMEAKATEEIQRRKINMRCDKDKNVAKEEMERRENLGKNSKFNEEIERGTNGMQIEVKLREVMPEEKKKIEMQGKNESRKSTEKDDINLEITNLHRHPFRISLENEKFHLLKEVPNLENLCTNLESVITEAEKNNSFTAIFINSGLKKKKAEAELKERTNCLKSKRERIIEIDNILNSMTTF